MTKEDELCNAGKDLICKKCKKGEVIVLPRKKLVDVLKRSNLLLSESFTLSPQANKPK